MKTSGVDLTIENADAVTLYFAAATNFVDYKDVSADQHKRVDDYLRQIESKSYETILTSAARRITKAFDRVSRNYPIQQIPFAHPERMRQITMSPDLLWLRSAISSAGTWWFVLRDRAPRPLTCRASGMTIPILPGTLNTQQTLILKWTTGPLKAAIFLNAASHCFAWSGNWQTRVARLHANIMVPADGCFIKTRTSGG